MTAITEFKGRYKWLSNFWPCKVRLEGWEYDSIEHAYQAAKCDKQEDRGKFLKCKAREAKAMGRNVPLPNDWEAKKIDIMRGLIRQKFAPGTELAAMLRHTGDAELVEGNTWGDTFWGVCNGVGENWLGKLLMEQRKIIQLAGYEIVCTNVRQEQEADETYHG